MDHFSPGRHTVLFTTGKLTGWEPVIVSQKPPPFQNWNEASQELQILLVLLRTSENEEFQYVREAFEKSALDQS